jgi:heat shock protein HslJ
MKKIILIMAAAAMLLGLNACKSKQKAAEAGAQEAAASAKLLFGKTWQLAELNGNPVQADAYINFEKDFRFNGKLGCNLMNGVFTLNGNKIKFDKIVATQKMCINMEVENELKRVLEIADGFYCSGKELTFIRARMSPLAKFEVKK